MAGKEKDESLAGGFVVVVVVVEPSIVPLVGLLVEDVAAGTSAVHLVAD